MTTRFMKHLFCSSLLLALVAGCGKNEKSGGSSGVFNPLISNLPANSQQAVSDFQAWYNSTTEGSIPSLGNWTERRTVKTYSASNNCNNQNISVFGLSLGSLNLCFNASAPASSQTQSRSVSVVSGSSKSGNTKLTQLINEFSASTIISATESASQVGGNSKVFILNFQRSNGSQVTYIVDSGYHSAFNPVYIMDTNTRSDETVTYIGY